MRWALRFCNLFKSRAEREGKKQATSRPSSIVCESVRREERGSSERTRKWVLEREIYDHQRKEKEKEGEKENTLVIDFDICGLVVKKANNKFLSRFE